MAEKDKDNWKSKLRKNPAYIFYLINKVIISFIKQDIKKKAITAPAAARPIQPLPEPAPVTAHAMPEAKIELEKIDLDPSKLSLACIMDVFTKSCFSPEFNLISPTPQNWRQILDQYPLDALFVESAWHGNDDAWLYRIGMYQEKFMDPIRALLDACKQKNIPAIFWNKEDPVHFEKFLDTAHRFDYIFTTDADCIPKYLEHTTHKNVFALPFAAQPKIHNPIRESPRDGNVCFAGTYHAARYADRRSDMDVILKPALDFGLDIYDRMYGTEGKAAENYRFPDIYQPSIRGKLDYDEMVKAYRKYKVFLNVNSVRNSPTMFARRVFELLACGTPVISTYSRGIIEILGEDTVFMTESEEETNRYLEKLVHDETFWWKQSLHGIRKVMEHHTYYHRTREIFGLAGLKLNEHVPVSFLVISRVSSYEQARQLAHMLGRQIYRTFKVLLILDDAMSINDTLQSDLTGIFGPVELKLVTNSEAEIDYAIAGVQEVQYGAIILPHHFYGKNYLGDYALAINYSEAKKLGKSSCYRLQDNGKIFLENKGGDFRWANEVPAATLVIRLEDLISSGPAGIINMKTVSVPGSGILSIDPFNFIFDGMGVAESIQHETAI